MKRILISAIVILFISFVSAQDDKKNNPTVELPEFVITGSDAVSVMKAKKIEPELVSLLNEEILRPSQSPEQLETAKLSDPIRAEFNLLDSLNYFTGKIEAGIGSFTLPRINFLLSSPFDNGLFQLTASGKNKRAHVEKSELYRVKGGVNVFYQISSESPLFNGTKLQFHGDYGRTSYNLFAANDPFIKRDLNSGNVKLSVENLLEEKFNYALSFSDDIHSLQESVYSENFLKLGGMFRANLASFNLGINSWYNVQMLKNDLVLKSNSDLFSIRSFIGFMIKDFLKALLGVSYMNFKDQNKFYPYMFSGLKVNDRISAYFEFAPNAELLGSGHFLDLNPYFQVEDFINFVHERKNAFQVSVKYEYEKYYEVNAGLKYFTSEASPFFENSLIPGRFKLSSVSSSSYTLFANSLFHTGPFGYLYGSIELNQTKSTNGRILPYHPAINAYVSYGYNFNVGLESKLTLNYLSQQYADISNTNSISPFINLALDFTYKISPEFNLTFELNNLLNRNNVLWAGYKETPLDLVAGIIYRW